MFLVESINRESNTDIYVFSRDKDGIKHIKKVSSFKPYFYVPEDATMPDDYRITGVETGHVDVFGKKLKKVLCAKSADIYQIRALFSLHYEADILVTQRYIIDNYDDIDIYPLKILSLDIETDSCDTFPNMEDPDQIVVSCSFVDSDGNEDVLVYKHKDCKVDITNATVYNSEVDLLNAIVMYIKKNDPDILTGWNVADFDFTYLIRRMDKLEVNYRRMSPLNSVRIDDRYNDVIIKGRIILDGMESYKHFRRISNQGRAESYSLEFTAQDILGKGKIPHTERFHEMWMNNTNDLLKYNLRDSQLVMELLKKLDIVEFFNYIRAKSHSQMAQIYQTTNLVDGYLLHHAHNKFVLPSKKRNEHEDFSGAHVFEPIPGLYKNVFGLDVKGMYPNIIKTFNIGYETFNPDGEIQFKPGIGFNRETGMISKIYRSMEKERGMYKKLKSKHADEGNMQLSKLNHYKQYAIKVIMNSFFGYLGFPGGRLYKREVAEAITGWGQLIIKWTETYLKQNDYKVLYGDTDSVYVQAHEDGIMNTIKEGKDLVIALNHSYDDFVKQFGAYENTIELEFEKIFNIIMFVKKKGDVGGAKKRYAYILDWEDGKLVKDDIHLTGFDSVRSDSPRIAREVQTKVINMVLHETKKEVVMTYLKDLDKKIRTGQISFEEIGFPKGISKPLNEYGRISRNEYKKEQKCGIPPVIAGSIYSNKYLGTRFGVGSKPKWTYIKQVPKGYPKTPVISFVDELPDGFIPDYDIIMDRLFKMKLDNIFRAAGFGEMPDTNYTAKSLNNFFGDAI